MPSVFITSFSYCFLIPRVFVPHPPLPPLFTSGPYIHCDGGRAFFCREVFCTMYFLIIAILGWLYTFHERQNEEKVKFGRRDMALKEIQKLFLIRKSESAFPVLRSTLSKDMRLEIYGGRKRNLLIIHLTEMSSQGLYNSIFWESILERLGWSLVSFCSSVNILMQFMAV